MLAQIPGHTLYACYMKLFLDAEDEGLSKMKSYSSDWTSFNLFTSDRKQGDVLSVHDNAQLILLSETLA